MRRIATFARRGRVLVAATVAALLAAVGLLNSTFDLWDRIRGTGPGTTGTIEVGYRTGEPGRVSRQLWHERETGCEPSVPGTGPFLTVPGRDVEAGGGTVGTGHEQSPVFVLEPLVHEDVIDVDPEGFSRDAFLELGAYVAGSQEIRVVLANRTDEQLVVTDMSLDVERHRPPNGTLMRQPGGDPSPVHVISFDLNEADPVARGIRDDCAPGAPFFARYALVVDPGQTEVFAIELIEADCLCLVRLNIEHWHQGRWRTLTVPDAGSDPIPVTAVSPEPYRMVYIDNSGFAVDGPPMEKYDCRREGHPLCARSSGTG
jgi:hypothetical protein